MQSDVNDFLRSFIRLRGHVESTLIARNRDEEENFSPNRFEVHKLTS